MTKPITDREQAIQTVLSTRLDGVLGEMHLNRLGAERIVDALGIAKADPEKFWQERYEQQHETVHNMEDEIARLRKLTQSLTETVQDLCEYVHEAAGDESVLLNISTMEMFSESEAHKLRLKLGKVQEAANLLAQAVEWACAPGRTRTHAYHSLPAALEEFRTAIKELITTIET